jgi:hypothetical protein
MIRWARGLHAGSAMEENERDRKEIRHSRFVHRGRDAGVYAEALSSKAVVAGVCLVSSASAYAYSSLFIFGDSLSDLETTPSHSTR